HHFVRGSFQLDKVHQQTNVVEFTAARIDLDAVVVSMQVFTLPLITAQLVRARKIALDHYFKLSRHVSYSSLVFACCASSIFLRKLSGRMAVETSFIYARPSALVPVLPASFQPNAFSRSAGQIEYCSSWFITTLYIVWSSDSSRSMFVLLRNI